MKMVNPKNIEKNRKQREYYRKNKMKWLKKKFCSCCNKDVAFSAWSQHIKQKNHIINKFGLGELIKNEMKNSSL